MEWPPDYTKILLNRATRMDRLRDPAVALGAREYYRDKPIEWIEHWAVTYDPRNGANGLPKMMPFVLFPRQREYVDFICALINSQTDGLVEKSRDMGATWISCALSVHQWIYNDGISIGWGSRKEQLVDRLGDPDSIFEKMRLILDYLPQQLRPKGYDRATHATYMKVINPETGATITGEAGDNIGRGGRKAVYFKDEAQPLYSSILTPTGWKSMGDICVGDDVIGSNGRKTKVIGVNDVGVAPAYRFFLGDGTHVDCSENHLWTVVNSIGKKKTETISASAIAERAIYKSPGGQVQYRYRVPLVMPVNFSEKRKPHALHPYIVGALLGDGSVGSGGISITSADAEIIEKIRTLLPDGCAVNYSERYSYRISDVRRYTKSSRAINAVRLSGIYGSRSYDKFIPDAYKFASIEDRIELLRGLLDTDGSASGGTITYHTCSKKLADDVRFVVQSLGGVASLNVKPDHRGYRDMYCLHISMNGDIVPFSLERKKQLMPKRGRHFGKTIKRVEKIEDTVVRCISVAAGDGLYVTDGCTLTHNSAHYQRPELIEAALADNTNVQVDISSVNGTNNVFYRRRAAGEIWTPDKQINRGSVQVLIMDWRDHPAKDQEWYDRRRAKAEADGLLHVFAQEVDRDYAAAVEGVIIPPAWVKSAINAHEKLGVKPSGQAIAGLDVADEGGDKNALVIRKGIVVQYADHWGEGDTGSTARKAIMQCRARGVTSLQYDCIGVGAGVKSECNNLRTAGKIPDGFDIVPWNAAKGPLWPERRVNGGDRDSPKNKDFYSNLKAQAWWELRGRFERTHKAVTQGAEYDAAELISIPSTLPNLHALVNELSQPTYKHNGAGKLVIDKKPNSAQSPNLADAFVMAFWPAKQSARFFA